MAGRLIGISPSIRWLKPQKPVLQVVDSLTDTEPCQKFHTLGEPRSRVRFVVTFTLRHHSPGNAAVA